MEAAAPVSSLHLPLTYASSSLLPFLFFLSPCLKVAIFYATVPFFHSPLFLLSAARSTESKNKSRTVCERESPDQTAMVNGSSTSASYSATSRTWCSEWACSKHVALIYSEWVWCKREVMQRWWYLLLPCVLTLFWAILKRYSMAANVLRV